MKLIIAVLCVGVTLNVVNSCGDLNGLHCISGKWDCPGSEFKDGITKACQKHCCYGCNGGLCTPDYLKKGAKVLVNPNYPAQGRCSYCPNPKFPKGADSYDYTCVDQRVYGYKASNNCPAPVIGGKNGIYSNDVQSGKVRVPGPSDKKISGAKLNNNQGVSAGSSNVNSINTNRNQNRNSGGYRNNQFNRFRNPYGYNRYNGYSRDGGYGFRQNNRFYNPFNQRFNPQFNRGFPQTFRTG